MHLVGLKDDYINDGSVITAALAHPSSALRSTRLLAVLYAQLNSSVGTFATETLLADSKALASGNSTSDRTFTAEQAALARLVNDRDRTARQIKRTLAAAAAGHHVNRATVHRELATATLLLIRAAALRAHV